MIKNHKIAVIIPYFGKLPKYFELFKKSLFINKNTTFIFFTDGDIKKENNVEVYKMTFDEFRSKIQNCFDFEIKLEKPYKICDYRPAFGIIFKDYLRQYDFWGHCDCDMIFGCYENFISDNILENNDKIFQNGHLTLYKNNDIVNHAFWKSSKVKDIFTTNVSCVFDEVKGIQKTFDELGLKTYKMHPFADISPWHDNFIKVTSWLTDKEKKNFNYKNQIFFYNNGLLYWIYSNNKRIVYREISYIHFQKRNLLNIQKNSNSFLITKLGFIPIKKENINNCTLKKYNRFSFFKELNKRKEYYVFRLKHKLEVLKNDY